MMEILKTLPGSFGNQNGDILIQTPHMDGEITWSAFRNPIDVFRVDNHSGVIPVLRTIDELVKQGLWAAGFISYEAASGFDRVLTTGPAGPLPYLWFGLYRESAGLPNLESLPVSPQSICPPADWKPSHSLADYKKRIREIKEYIASGDTYQVNYSFRLNDSWEGDPFTFFQRLVSPRPGPFSAYLNLEDFAICCASPELFFSLDKSTIRCQPMKGTHHRGLDHRDDAYQKEQLQQSRKNRAENLMIVDMVRNDLSRIAESGSVKVTELFKVDRFPTLFQMTSEVQARTSCSLPEILKAMFPAASITGAPKVRTMQIISELETRPRGIYTGTIGCIAPSGKKAQFNVAIRTACIEKNTGKIEYGVGSGIVWDSIDDSEYQECMTKALVLNRRSPEFELLETIKWTPEGGYYLLEYHLERLQNTAEYFCYHLDQLVLRIQLKRLISTFNNSPHRVRLLVNKSGRIELATKPLDSEVSRTICAVLDDRPINKTDPFLYHKTTNREVYNRAREARPEQDDVLLWNHKEEITEFTIGNVVVEFSGCLYTPPVQCGLLEGTFRRSLLEEKKIATRVIYIKDLAKADSLYLINSVKEWVRVDLKTERVPIEM